MSVEHRSLCRSTQLLRWFFLTQAIKSLTIALDFKDVSGLCWFIYWHIFRRLDVSCDLTPFFKKTSCQLRQTLRWKYNAIPMWSCQVSSIHTYRTLYYLRFEQHIWSVFYRQWFRWWPSVAIAYFSDSILEYLIKSASSSFIRANTFINLFFKYAIWSDTNKTPCLQLFALMKWWMKR